MSKPRARWGCANPPRSKIFHFHGVFDNFFLKIIGCVPNLRDWTPRPGNPDSANSGSGCVVLLNIWQHFWWKLHENERIWTERVPCIIGLSQKRPLWSKAWCCVRLKFCSKLDDLGGGKSLLPIWGKSSLPIWGKSSLPISGGVNRTDDLV